MAILRIHCMNNHIYCTFLNFVNIYVQLFLHCICCFVHVYSIIFTVMCTLRKYRFVMLLLLIILSTYICQFPPVVMKARSLQGQSKLRFPNLNNSLSQNLSWYENNTDSFSMQAAWLSVDSPFELKHKLQTCSLPFHTQKFLCAPLSFKAQSQ